MKKRILALILAAVMVFGIATMVSAEFSDEKDISAKYKLAVFAMNDKGVIGGFPDGSFQPKGTLTRAQAAKILCSMMVGENVPDGTTEFSDVPASHWAAKFVAWCAAEGIVAGVGGGKFNPDGKLTGYAFGKMLLVANGHDAQKDGLTGAGWDTNTAKLLSASDLDYNLKLSNGEITRQEACQLAYNFTLPNMDKTGFEEITLSMKDNADSYRALGRTILADDGLQLRFSTSGIEFTANFAGDLTMKYTAVEEGYLRVYIDGEESSLHPHALQTTSPKNLKLATNIRSGQHSVRILKDGDISKEDAAIVFHSVTFTGEKDSAAPTSERPLFIEFVGDSITVGKYILGEENVESAHSGVLGYAYQAAQILDADWMLTARGGIGFKRTIEDGDGSCPITMGQAYEYLNPFAKDEDKVKYDFARKADLVVLALGTNDNAEDYAIKAEAKKLVDQIKAAYGSDVKIVVFAGMMTTGKNTMLEEFAKANKLYYFQVTANTKGGHSHPSGEAQAEDARLLAEYIQTIL